MHHIHPARFIGRHTRAGSRALVRVLCACALLTALPTPSASPQVFSFEDPRITVDVSPSNAQPDMAMDSRGHAVAVWRHSGDLDGGGASDTGDDDIVAVYSADEGATWSGPVVVTANDNGDYDSNPVVATNGAGVWVALWETARTLGGNPSELPDILFATSTDDGATWSGPQPLNAYMDDPLQANNWEDRTPSIAYGNGQWVAVWKGNTSVLDGVSTIGTDYETVAAFSNAAAPAATADWSNGRAVSSNGSGNADEDAVVAYGNGRFLAIWHLNRDQDGAGPDNTDEDVVFSYTDTPVSSGSWTAPVFLNSDMGPDNGDDAQVALASDGVGNWVAVWRSVAPNVDSLAVGTDGDIFVAHSGDNGSNWSGSRLLNSYGTGDTGDEIGPSVATDGRGLWLAAWRSDYDDGVSGPDTDHWAARSTDGGLTWSAAELVRNNVETEEIPVLGTDTLGEWILIAMSNDDLNGVIDGARDLLVWREPSPSVFAIPLFNIAQTGEFTRAAEADFWVLFQEDVTGVDETDFTLRTTGAVSGAIIKPGSVAPIFGDPQIQSVTVLTGTGDGEIHLDVIDDDSIVGSLGVPLGGYGASGLQDGSFNQGDFYVVDKTRPTADSVAPVLPGPTNAVDIDFLVVFNEPIRIIGAPAAPSFNDAADVVIVHSGTAHAGVSIARVLGQPEQFVVTVQGVSGEGSFTLAASTASDIQDRAGNLLLSSVTSAPMLVEHVAPTADTITPDTIGPTNLDEIGFTIVFNEPVQNFDEAADVSVTHNGTAHGGVVIVDTGDQQTYRATLTELTGVGGFSLSVNVDSDVRDLAGNALASSVNSANVSIDRVTPEAITITPEVTGPIDTDEVEFNVAFSEPVAQFDDESDLVITHTGTAHAAAAISDAGDQQHFTVTVSGIDGDGEFTVAVSTVSDVQDNVGNAIAASVVSVPVAIDTTAPSVSEITAPDATAPTNRPDLVFEIVFSEAISGVNTAPPFDDFAAEFTQAGKLAPAVTGVVETLPGQAYRVTITRGDGDGQVRLVVLDTGGIVDSAGHPLSGPATSAAGYTISELRIDSDLPQDLEATEGDRVEFGVLAAGGTAPYTYTWEFTPEDKASPPPPDAPAIVLDPVGLGDAGTYQCTISDAYETVESGALTLTVLVGIPALNLGGLILLAVATATAGRLYTRRRIAA